MSFMATFSKMLMILFAISMGYLANRLKKKLQKKETDGYEK